MWKLKYDNASVKTTQRMGQSICKSDKRNVVSRTYRESLQVTVKRQTAQLKNGQIFE